MYLSRYAGGRGLDGRLAQLRIFSRAIDAHELHSSMFVDGKDLVLIEDPDTKQWRDIPRTAAEKRALDCSVPIFAGVSIPMRILSSAMISAETAVMGGSFLQFFNNSLLSDVAIEVREMLSDDPANTFAVVFPAHKMILMTRSEYFHAMFSSAMMESQSAHVHISDVNPRSFALFLEILYCSNETEIDQTIKKAIPDGGMNKVNQLMDFLMLSERFQLKNYEFFQSYLDKHLVSEIYGIFLKSYDDFESSLCAFSELFESQGSSNNVNTSNVFEGLNELKKLYHARGQYRLIEPFVRSFQNSNT